MEIYHPQGDELIREMRRVRRAQKRKRLLWGLLFWLVITAVGGWFVFHRYYTVVWMRGPAMGATIPDGSLVLIRLSPDEGYVTDDVILYEREDGYQLKRILAIGGDRVVISPYGTQEIRVNSQDLKTRYITGRAADAGLPARRLTVDDGTLFVAGDQRSLSVDCRDRDYETIPRESVIGRADTVLWPIYLLRNINGEDDITLMTKEDPEETAAPAEATKGPAPRETEKPTAAETPETAPVTAFPAAEQAGNAEMPAVLMHPENRSENEPDETAPESPDGTGAEEGAAE